MLLGLKIPLKMDRIQVILTIWNIKVIKEVGEWVQHQWLKVWDLNKNKKETMMAKKAYQVINELNFDCIQVK